MKRFILAKMSTARHKEPYFIIDTTQPSKRYSDSYKCILHLPNPSAVGDCVSYHESAFVDEDDNLQELLTRYFTILL